MKRDHQRVQALLAESITVLCKNGLQYRSNFSIQGLLGITLDDEEVFLVDIHEKVGSDVSSSNHGDQEGNQEAPIRTTYATEARHTRPVAKHNSGVKRHHRKSSWSRTKYAKLTNTGSSSTTLSSSLPTDLQNDNLHKLFVPISPESRCEIDLTKQHSSTSKQALDSDLAMSMEEVADSYERFKHGSLEGTDTDNIEPPETDGNLGQRQTKCARIYSDGGISSPSKVGIHSKDPYMKQEESQDEPILVKEEYEDSIDHVKDDSFFQVFTVADTVPQRSQVRDRERPTADPGNAHEQSQITATGDPGLLLQSVTAADDVQLASFTGSDIRPVDESNHGKQDKHNKLTKETAEQMSLADWQTGDRSEVRGQPRKLTNQSSVPVNLFEATAMETFSSVTDSTRLSLGHKCPFCDKLMPTPSKMQRHIRTHTGERPYMCGECGKAFSQGATLKRHLLMIHRPVLSVPAHTDTLETLETTQTSNL